MPRRSIVALTFAILFAGCVRFEPRPLSPSETAASLEARNLESAELKAFFEKALKRPVAQWPQVSWDFESLYVAALYFHPSLDVARARWRLAAAGIKTAGGRPNPTLTVTPGYDFNSTGLSPWLPVVFVDLPIETAGKRGQRIAEASQLSESARLVIASTAWGVRSNLRGSLLDYSAARERERLLLRQIETQEKVVHSLEQQLQAGAISSSELTLVRIALAKIRLDLTDAQREHADARVRIADAIGIPVKALDGHEFGYNFTAATAVSDLTSAEARDRALQGRADILGALAEYAASQSALKLQIAKQYPDIHLGPGYQFDHGEHTFTLDLTAELPVLNQNKGPIAEAEARRGEVAARFVSLQAKIISDIDRAVAAYRVAQEHSSTLETLAEAQKKQSAAIEAQLNAGAASALDLMNAQIELGASDLLLFDGRVRLHQSLAALEDAIQRPIDSIQPGIIETSPRQALSEKKP